MALIEYLSHLLTALLLVYFNVHAHPALRQQPLASVLEPRTEVTQEWNDLLDRMLELSLTVSTPARLPKKLRAKP